MQIFEKGGQAGMRESFYRLPGPQKLRVALVSDLHGRPYGRVLASLDTRKPDLICMAGDFVHGVIPPGRLALEEQPAVLPFFRECAALAPCFVSLGNHEWLLRPEELAAIRETGVRLLDNAWTRYGPFVIGGLSSSYVTGYRRFCAEQGGGFPVPENIHAVASGVLPELEWLEDYTAQAGWRLLLCHHPEYWPRFLRELPIPLTLSGHAHGGQIRLFGQGLYAPGQGLLPQYTSGLYEGRLLVSRGLSNNVAVPRLFNPTELVYLDLEA